MGGNSKGSGGYDIFQGDAETDQEVPFYVPVLLCLYWANNCRRILFPCALEDQYRGGDLSALDPCVLPYDVAGDVKSGVDDVYLVVATPLPATASIFFDVLKAA